MSSNQPFNTNNPLAQPEPVGVTDEELIDCMIETAASTPTGQSFAILEWPDEAVALARAVLARWGNASFDPIPCSETTMMQAVEHEGRSILVPAQPEPVGPTDEELWALYQDQGRDFSPTAFARAVLASWGRPAITPIPVSERLPYDAECSDEGECWWFHAGAERWDLLPRPPLKWMEWTHWLPAHALPLPGQPAQDS